MSPRRRRTGNHRRSLLWRWRRLLFLVGLVGVAGLAGAGYVVSSIPLPPEQLQAQTTILFDGTGQKLAELHAEEDRINVGLETVPDVMVDAVLAAEDKDFFRHSGVDPFAIMRATWADIRNKAAVQGGSTITQQYVKNVYLDRDRTLTRKIKEAVLAVKIERELDKREILERYLNTVYFGRGAYGVQTAARAYFDKDVGSLTLPEASYLAGLIRAPELADAAVHPDVADRRRATVLRAMVDAGFIDGRTRRDVETRAVSAYVLPRPPRSDPEVVGRDIGTEYFVEYVRQALSHRYGDATVFGGGLRVHTTLDMRLQRAAYEAVTSTLDRPGDPAAALVAIDNQGHVKAMVGGRDFAHNKVNYAVGKEGGGTGRQPGSAFKPFVLAEAVHEGYSVESAFDAPARIVLPKANAGRDWRVANYGGSSFGTLNLIDATRNSVNTVYAQLVIELGAAKVAALANSMGVTTELPAVNALALGVGEVSVLELASAYSTFANRGERIDPVAVTRVDTADGEVREEFSQRRQRVLTEREADTVNHVLRGVIESGTGTGARIGKPAAGKTGTTQNNGDAWFAGYTPTLTAVVWMGYPEGQEREMNNVHGRAVTGGSFPATIWRKFMQAATRGVPTGTFPSVRYSGRILNKRLPAGQGSTTTSSSSSSSSTSSTVPGETTTTVAGDGTTSSTTPPTTTAPPTTTTTRPPPTTSTVLPGSPSSPGSPPAGADNGSGTQSTTARSRPPP